MIIHIEEGSMHFDVLAEVGSPAKLVNFSNKPYSGEEPNQYFRYNLVEAHFSGWNLMSHHALKHDGSGIGHRLEFVSHNIEKTELGQVLTINQQFKGIEVISEYNFYSGVDCVRCKTYIKNNTEDTVTLEYVSSFCMYQLDMGDWENNTEILIPNNSWTIECNWKRFPIRELGLFSGGDNALKRISLQNTGSWSTVEYLPMGMLKNKSDDFMYYWQIENNGSWTWEVADREKKLYISLMGPTLEQGAFAKNIGPGEVFESVPAAIGVTKGDFEEASQELTKYRRIIRRKDDDNVNLPVVFNDFIALCSSPTEEAEYPLIDAAAKLGCEIYCIDAGWYDTGDWWDRVGEWQVCYERFPNGLRPVTKYIEDKGMIPGIWLEPEVMGIACPTAADLPDDWFFCRYGKRVIDNRRYLLDYRNPEVRKYITGIVEGLINDYGIRYFKFDFNVTGGLGTELSADSFGDGLLQHGRALLDWATELLENHPEVTIETCGSGGCRMDYAMLSVYSMQSVSDQSDYRKVSRISALCASAITPEQAGIWNAPKDDATRKEVAFNLINTSLARMHQSGHVDRINEEAFQMLKEGIALYKDKIRKHIANALPIWPMGQCDSTSGQIVYAWKNEETKKGFLAAWRLNGEAEFDISLSKYNVLSATPIYPVKSDYEDSFENGNLKFNLSEEYSAVLFELDF